MLQSVTSPAVIAAERRVALDRGHVGAVDGKIGQGQIPLLHAPAYPVQEPAAPPEPPGAHRLVSESAGVHEGQLRRHPRRRPQLSSGAELPESYLPLRASLGEVVVGIGDSAQHDVGGRRLTRLDRSRECPPRNLEVPGGKRHAP